MFCIHLFSILARSTGPVMAVAVVHDVESGVYDTPR